MRQPFFLLWGFNHSRILNPNHQSDIVLAPHLHAQTHQLQMSAHFLQNRIKMKVFWHKTLSRPVQFFREQRRKGIFDQGFQFVLTKPFRLSLRRDLVRADSSFSLQEPAAACLLNAVPASERCIRTPAHTNTTWRKPADLVKKPMHELGGLCTC